MAISRERAIELVESLLAEIPPWTRELAIRAVVEHALGWVVSWNSAGFARTGDRQYALVGGGPYPVDRHDGSVHHIPVTTFVAEDWAALHLRQVKGIRPPDPLAAEVRGLAQTEGAVAAMARLRRRAPRLRLLQAKAYPPAVREGAEPPETLADLTEEKAVCPPLPIETVRRGRG
ncbi:YrhB domain-containing protein [Kitasatospora sp. NPDC093102]|uniref:YrhB domain-containing protein n=1 Tax=Kitasatospora sp. NPDC093102 TaxID=3155069 RepID=UPI003421FA6F